MQQPPRAAALAAVLLSAGCVTAKPGQAPQATPSHATASATAAKDSQNPVICVRVENTGSRLAEKECHTASGWAAQKRQGLDDLSNRAQRGLSGQNLTPGN
jgi:hypothetical protein